MRRVVMLATLLLIPLPLRSDTNRPPPPPPPPPPPNNAPSQPAPGLSCVGRWQGVGRGSSGNPWTIDMNVTSADARCGTIEYPSLGCGGYLIQCQVGGGRMTAVEVYTHNPGTCAPAGSVRAECDASSMRWVWTGQEIVRSVLRRI